MDEKIPLPPRQYAIYFFAPLIVIAIFFKLVSVPLLIGSYFLLGYLWNAALLSPYVKDKREVKRYRLSFIILVYKSYSGLMSLLKIPENTLRGACLRSLFPSLFCLTLLELFDWQNRILFVFVGSIVFELFSELVNLYWQMKVRHY